MSRIKRSVFLAAAVLTAGSVLAQSREVRQTVSLDRDGRVIIDTFKGSIDIQTWNEPRVEIVARIEADPSGDDQEDRVEKTKVRIYGSDRLVEIESDYSDADYHEGGFFGFFFGGGTIVLPFVHYDIRMPRNAKLDIEDHKSEIRIRGMDGDLTLATHKGHAVIDRFSGGARIETHKGDIRVDFRKLTRPSNFETYKGEIEIFVPSGSSFRVGGDLGEDARLDSEFAMLTHSFGDEERISADINGGNGPEIWMESYKGTIRLRKGDWGTRNLERRTRNQLRIRRDKPRDRLDRLVEILLLRPARRLSRLERVVAVLQPDDFDRRRKSVAGHLIPVA